MNPSNLVIVLHAHLPYVRHPEHEYFLEENWLFEAITESYLPLIHVFRRLEHEGIPFSLTLSISPTLMAMLQDRLLGERYMRYLDQRIELTRRELHRTRSDPEFNETVRMYHDRFVMFRDLYDSVYKRDLVTAFSSFREGGRLEIITTAATHGFLPHLNCSEESVSAQLGVAAANYEAVFGDRPEGLWLPECGYYEGLDSLIARAGYGYFFMEAHGVMFGTPPPSFGTWTPVVTPAEMVVFPRDPFASGQVWSSVGYPGDFHYRDFYRDIGFDLPREYLSPVLPSHEIGTFTGLKYYRITNDRGEKEPYNRAAALARAEVHAEHFVREIRALRERMGVFSETAPCVTCAFDAELFGHWWFEGPEWLETVFRKLADTGNDVRPLTARDYMGEVRPDKLPAVSPAPSSWGRGGAGAVWLNRSNDWIYPMIHRAAGKMVRLAEDGIGPKKNVNPEAIDNSGQLLNSAAVELLLAQASDWPFLIDGNEAPHYSELRVRGHIERFNRVIGHLEKDSQPTGRWKTEDLYPGLFRHTDCTPFFLPADRRRDRP